ncbi:hypothetical protein MRX96_002278 [Rhipicephalus microplus]
MHPPYDLPAPEGGQPFHHEPDEQWANQPLLAVQAEAATAEHHGTWDKAPVGHIPPTLRSPARHHGIWGGCASLGQPPFGCRLGSAVALKPPTQVQSAPPAGPRKQGQNKIIMFL